MLFYCLQRYVICCTPGNLICYTSDHCDQSYCSPAKLQTSIVCYSLIEQDCLCAIILKTRGQECLIIDAADLDVCCSLFFDSVYQYLCCSIILKLHVSFCVAEDHNMCCSIMFCRPRYLLYIELVSFNRPWSAPFVELSVLGAPS